MLNQGPSYVPTGRFVAATSDGATFTQDDETTLFALLPDGTYIIKDELYAQAVFIHKERLARGHRNLSPLFLPPEEGFWALLRGLEPGRYLVPGGEGREPYLVNKLAARWEIVLVRRHACWLRGQELSSETELELAQQLRALEQALT